MNLLPPFKVSDLLCYFEVDVDITHIKSKVKSNKDALKSFSSNLENKPTFEDRVSEKVTAYKTSKKLIKRRHNLNSDFLNKKRPSFLEMFTQNHLASTTNQDSHKITSITKPLKFELRPNLFVSKSFKVAQPQCPVEVATIQTVECCTPELEEPKQLSKRHNFYPAEYINPKIGDRESSCKENWNHFDTESNLCSSGVSFDC